VTNLTNRRFSVEQIPILLRQRGEGVMIIGLMIYLIVTVIKAHGWRIIHLLLDWERRNAFWGTLIQDDTAGTIESGEFTL
jgi:hypothetical protein